MKRIVMLMLVLCISGAYAQQTRDLELNKDKDLIEVTYYHDNGQISQTGFYTTDGKLHGEWFSYCDKGEKLVSAKYDMGVKVGKWFFWQGDLLREVDYSNGAILAVNEWKNTDTAVASNDEMK